MRERQISVADLLAEEGVLIDARYRIDGLIRRTATATVHLATHRNGSTAWLKMPHAAEHGAAIALEARIANTIGSPLVVRDDGTTPEGLPYLVLDPPDAESLASLRARAAKGARLDLPRVLTAGDALARVIASLHAIGYVTVDLDDASILVFGNGDVALLDLHALAAVSPEGVAADVKRVATALKTLLAEVADAALAESVRAALGAALAGTYPDVAGLQAAWRAASPEPIATPASRGARVGSSGSFPDLPPLSAPILPVHDTPMSLSVGNGLEPEGSIIGYLRSARGPSIAPAPSPHARDHAVMYDPLSKLAEVPRLVQAASHATPREKRGPGRALVVTLVALPLLVVALGAAVVMASGSNDAAAGVKASTRSAAALEAAPVATAIEPAPLAEAVPAPVPAPAPSAPAPPAADDLELNTALSTENAPPGRDVFLDGRVIGRTPLRVTVPCGTHSLQMVAGAAKQPVDLPCGGTRVVRYDAKGHWALK